jgi:serine/threonine protein kinase
MSPEMLNLQDYSFYTDIWSLGCIILEVISLNHLFSYIQHKYSTMIFQKQIPNFNEVKCSVDLKFLIQEMLYYDSSKRISSFNLERNPLLLKYNSIIPKNIVTFIFELLSSLDNKTKEVINIKSSCSKFQLEKENLQSEINQLKEECKTLKKDNTKLKNENEQLKEHSQLKNSLSSSNEINKIQLSKSINENKTSSKINTNVSQSKSNIPFDNFSKIQPT